MKEIPKKYRFSDVEQTWMERWETWQLHAFDPDRPRDETFVVDTPPPTVSGSLHIGHVFSYTHQDLLVRYQRMKGRNIYYPMGWDDNGLPTERRVQNLFKIRCEPHLPYDPEWTPDWNKTKKAKVEDISRRNFIEACGELTAKDEEAFENLWRHLGLSIDWNEQYETINEHCRRVSQASFLDLMAKGEVYQTEAPTMWDVDFKTAVAQAEVEDRPKYGAMHDLRFGVEGGGEFTISTTRPELLAACIAVVAHPEDERYQDHFGKKALTPLFGAEVPILPAEHADPEKGTGILMVCTFGDSHDVEWWKQSGLALKQIIGTQGRLLPLDFSASPFESRDTEYATKTWAELEGKNVRQARRRIVELLMEDGSGPRGEGAGLLGEPRPVEQSVKFYEKGDRPLEFVTTRQWFVRILDHKDELLAQGAKVQWHPPHMRTRYDHWVEGLNQDWCISRQRYFGIPFPVWYSLDDHGQADYDHPILADLSSLPVDPMSEAAPGYEEGQRDQPGGFTGDPDVMDTWATSSMSPQISSGWPDQPERHRNLFPADVRPQSHEIIRTWAFYTVVKAWMHHGDIPWKHAVISGWILDPDRKKMSKSKGNVVTPGALLDQHSVDGVRYWAGRARLGTDTAFDEAVLKLGKRLATKLFNASRFALSQVDRAHETASHPTVDSITEPLDRAFIQRLRETVQASTASFEAFDYSGALRAAEELFWSFCDHYLELVKHRSYQDEDTASRRSAIATLRLSLSVFLRLFAPFLPFVTEEVWSWRFAQGEGSQQSIHGSPWPTLEELAAIAPPDYPASYDAAVEVVSAIRGAKSEAQKSLKWPVQQLEIRGESAALKPIESVLSDVREAGRVPENGVALAETEAPVEGLFDIQVRLADTDQ